MNKADAAEALIERQLQSAYSNALQKILKQNKSFIKLMKDVADGKIQPPQFYIDNGLEERWKQGFLQQALRQQQIIQQIAGQLDKTGERAGKTIKDGLSSAYFGQYSDTVHDISTEAQKAGIKTSFGSIDKRAVMTAVDDSQESSPFSKIAYKNLGNNTRIRRQLQNEMAQAIMLGESQTKVIKRIRDVVGNAQYNAKRTAQTEGTRIRSQARERAQKEAAEQGVRIVNEWSTNMDGKARDQHEAMNGKMVKQGEPFIMPNGDSMMYPADPAGSAENVINCRCVLIPHVLAKDEEFVDGKILKTKASYGYKTLTSINFDTGNDVAENKEAKKIVVSTSKRITRDFPTLDEYIYKIGYSNLEDGQPAQCSYAYNPETNTFGMTIDLNNVMWQNINAIKLLVERQAIITDTGLPSHVSSDVHSIIAHEYGHAAYVTYALRQIGYNGNGTMTEKAFDLFADQLYFLKAEIAKIKNDYNDNTISNRAEDDESQFVAQAFADYYYGIRKPISKAIVTFFKRSIGHEHNK